MTEDTICAPATGQGGAIAIIRVSGSNAIALTDTVFRSASGKPLSALPSSHICYGNIVDDEDSIIDDVLVSVFKSPHSYTGENATEISCHGSRYVIGRIMELLINAGCRQAEPGEYTKRAFLNGKLDLSQAEAVADLIAAGNRATHRMAMNQLRGHFSNELSLLRNELLKISSLVELELDFSDQDVSFADRDELYRLAHRIDDKIVTLKDSFKSGSAIKNGIPIVIIGKTNVGKSTLLNQLLHEDKAIVSSIHGTTRDVIEDTIDINGVTFRFIDTAGIRQTNDEIEQQGIARTYKKMQEASIVLWLIDETPDEQEFHDTLNRLKDKKTILVQNKIDLDARAKRLPTTDNIHQISISAKNGTNIEKLKSQIFELSDIPDIGENNIIITNYRHYEALLRAHESIERVMLGIRQMLSGDLLSEDLKQCIYHLGDIIGETITSEDTLSSIFQSFCIGK